MPMPLSARASARLFSALATLFLCLLTLRVDAAATNPPAYLGFTPDEAIQQQALEAKLDTLVEPKNLREWMKRLTAHPHHVGSPYGKEVAEFIAAQFRSWGFETEIEQFDVLFPTPKTRLLEMIAPEKFTASLMEPPLPAVPPSSLTAEQLPPTTLILSMATSRASSSTSITA